jgi:hypothetical protein
MLSRASSNAVILSICVKVSHLRIPPAILTIEERLVNNIGNLSGPISLSHDL